MGRFEGYGSDIYDGPPARRTTVGRIAIHCRRSIPAVLVKNAKFDITEGWQDGLLLELQTWVYGGAEREDIHFVAEWPADWWQHFKQRWFPRWALRRWPVVMAKKEYRDKKYGKLCPHLDADPRGHHIEFLSAPSL